MKTTFFVLIAASLTVGTSFSQPLKVGVAGLSHDHAHSLMQQFKRGEVVILGIAEADTKLIKRYKDQYELPDDIRIFKDVHSMLAQVKPEVVLAYNAIAEHIDVVEECAPLGISVMVEKPLATTVKQADRIADLAKQYHIQVLTNYETTWYPSNQQLHQMVQEQAIGPIRKMIVHDGHWGPREIGCSEEFLSWLTDPEKNGGGAIIDFGCYGANLMTWLMKGKTPKAVTAVTKQIKPDIYPRVDDEAVIVVEYEDATGIIEASWNWPFGIKDLEVFGKNGYLHAMNKNTLQERKKDTYNDVPVNPPAYADNLTYLAAVLRSKQSSVDDLSSLSNNLTVVKILDAARQSAKEGRRIALTK